MLNSWWELGEWSGYQGAALNLGMIECPFCNERGNFVLEHHAEKINPNTQKKLNFDTLKCNNCASFILVFWSGSAFSYGKHGMHDYRIIPFSLKVNSAPKEWPEEISRYWIQAKRSLQDGNWDAASVMARSAMQITLRNKGANGKNLLEEINDLSAKGILPPIMKDWANTLREIGNDSAHPKPEQIPTSKDDVVDVINFLDFLLEYLYSLPSRIDNFRERKKTS